MRAITVKQPWAWAIATGAKGVENRSRPHPWTSAVGERMAIHAGKGWDGHAFEVPILFKLAEVFTSRLHGDGKSYPVAGLIAVMVPEGHPRGAVVATARLAGVHHATDRCRCGTNPWAESDAWHLVLREIVPLREPVSCRGYQGLWSLPAHVEAAVQQVTAVPA